jgi:hypothetical protein
VVVNNGTLSNGQIVVAASTYTTPSYANQYDAAGNVAVRSTLAFSGDQIPDVRRGLVRPYCGWYAHTVGAPLTQRLVYDARSELVETDYAVAAGEVNRGAQSRETYDADGQVAQQAQFGRWGVDWKAVANKDDAGTLPDEINATPTVNSDGVLVAGCHHHVHGL